MYRIIENFIDKNTGRRYEIGEIVKFSNKRAKEILSVGNLIEKIEEPNEENIGVVE